MPRRDTIRVPLEPLRQRVAEATGRSASFIDLTEVEVTENALEVTVEQPEGDVPVVEVVVEGPDGRTDRTPARLDSPSGLRVYGELLRIEYAGRDAETDEILVSVDRKAGDNWETLLGCGQIWAVETTQNGESASVSCHVETPSQAEENEESKEAVADDDDSAPEGGGDEQPEEDAESADGFLSSLGG
ncbi:hypothetical protein [Halobellus marinus]|jgi:hypothetical protein|uniref:hypothetical protein n=1 Tax=Halobellus TaxID=1073986 RepID=UPI0028B22DA0|nr:hypothetical protein [Halobellus sp. DFY28]